MAEEERHWGKNGGSNFFYPGPVFDISKIVAQAIVHQNKSRTA